MKIIPKFQKGGQFETFFTTYTPIQAPSQAQREPSRSKQSSGDEEKGKLTEKDLFTMLKDIDGLPNEMSAIVYNLMDTFRLSNLTGADPSSLATTYLENLYQVKIAAQNKQKYDAAISAAQKNGAMAEPAISMDGNIVVQNSEGQIDTISLNEYLSNNGQYQPLTVSNLAKLRAYTPQLANNQSIFDIINNSMGFESFQSLVDQAKKMLGSSENIKNGYFSAEGQASKGLALLNSLSEDDRVRALGSVTAEGLYKYKIIDKSQLSQINHLLSYIAASFPDRAKTWAAIKLGTPDKNKALRTLIGQYLLSGNTESHSFEIDYKGSMEDNKNKSGNDITKMDNNMPTRFLQGYGYQSLYTLNPGTSSATQVLSISLPLTNKEDKPIGPNSTLQAAMEGNFSTILDFNNVSLGGNMIHPSLLKGIVATDGRINSIDYPINVELYNKTGEIVPNISPENIRKKQEAESEIKARGINLNDKDSIIQNYDIINKIYQEHQIYPAYNSDGTPTQMWRRFGVINVAADSRIVGDLPDKSLLREIRDDNVIDNLIEIVKDDKFDKNGWFSSDEFYSSTVWIPVKEDYHSARSGLKDTIGQDTALEIKRQLDAASKWNSGKKVSN